MATAAQIAANKANAQSSTGPRTETGKAASSKNSVVFGLYSGDFIRPDEQAAHAALHQALLQDLAPVGVLEEALVDEIRRAMWRLRRCGEVESHFVLRLGDGENYILDPMEALNSPSERIQKSVDRARSQAHRLLHKCTAELRRLQTERRRQPLPEEAKTPVAEQTRSEPAGTPRNAPCPCGSRQKFKRCCGRSAPGALHAA